MNIQLIIPVAENIKSAGSRNPRLTGINGTMTTEVHCDASLHAEVIDHLLATGRDSIDMTFSTDSTSYNESGFSVCATGILY